MGRRQWAWEDRVEFGGGLGMFGSGGLDRGIGSGVAGSSPGEVGNLWGVSIAGPSSTMAQSVMTPSRGTEHQDGAGVESVAPRRGTQVWVQQGGALLEVVRIERGHK